MGMATIEERAQLRRMTNLSSDDPVYTDDVLDTYVDNLGSLELAASAIWQEKAAAAASLVDVTESGSSRRLSQMLDQYQKMAAGFRPDPTDDTRGTSFTVGIERA